MAGKKFEMFSTLLKNLKWIILVLSLIGIIVGVVLFERYANSKEKFSEKPTLILFHAEWCGYCKKMKPEWDKMKVTLNEKYNNNPPCVIQELDVDDAASSEMFKKHNVSSFPTIKFITKDGEVIDFQGERVESEFLEFIEKNSS